MSPFGSPGSCPCDVARQQLRAPFDRDCAKVPQIKRRDGFRVKPLGHSDDGAVHQSELHGAVLPAELVRTHEVPIVAPLDLKRAFGKITEERTIGNIRAVLRLTERPFSAPRQPLPLTTAGPARAMSSTRRLLNVASPGASRARLQDRR